MLDENERTSTGAAVGTSVAASRPKLDDWSLPGFGPMTRIATDFGEVPAQALRLGDRVRTQQGPMRPIVWIDRVRLNEDFLDRHPAARPILIRKGALGPNLPACDIVVSPGQRVPVQARLPGQQTKTAAQLLSGTRILRHSDRMITYTRFFCEGPVAVRVAGVWMPVAP